MRSFLLSGVALALFPVLMLDVAHAQAYSRLAPKQLASPAQPVVIAPPGGGQSPLPQTGSLVTPSLKGLVFVSRSQDVQSTGVQPGAGGISHASLPLLGDRSIQTALSAHLGKPATFADLNAIARQVDAFYRSEGHPFVTLTIPPQNVSNGVIQILVTEYRLGEVRTKGNRWFSDRLIVQQSGLRPNQFLTLSAVQEDLDRLNTNPFRSTDAIFTAGQTQGTTDVILQTQDRLPLHVYASYDNAGVPVLGQSEWAVGGTWGNVAGLGQTLSYQFTHSVSDRYSGHALTWTAPLPWQDHIQVFGAYSWQKPDLGADNRDLGQSGHSGQASFRYIHDLPTISFGRKMRLIHDIQAGFDFKTTNNSLEFGGINVFASQAEVAQFPIVYNATMNDPWGQTSFQNQLIFSPGGLTGANRRRNFDVLVSGANDRYVYDSLSLTRTTWLPAKFSWILQATGQVSSTNLMYSNQLALGGLYTARGYNTDTVLGSEGVSVTNDLRAPAFSLLDPLGLRSALRDSEQIGVFFDYGHVTQVKSIPNARSATDLSSVGLDLHSVIGRYANLTFNVGWRLRGISGPIAQNLFGNKGAFGNLSLTVGY
ncbi:ShlB/FhaC/HecB family hemolysin secretion/activation protein [Asaia spathodeae]|uniref:ShlB/FhaC/HecB family hemolysin secretion/activation protein n=1 Tax=Asaia spathodeae TaxID=657016 RepID=UPI002FC2AA9A